MNGTEQKARHNAVRAVEKQVADLVTVLAALSAEMLKDRATLKASELRADALERRLAAIERELQPSKSPTTLRDVVQAILGEKKVVITSTDRS